MKAEPAVHGSAGGFDAEFSKAGFRIVPDVLAESDCESLARELTDLFDREQSGSRRRIGGVRNLLRLSRSAFEVARSSPIIRLVEQLTRRPTFPIRAMFFDKTAESNWRVAWHQDLTIAVAQRIDTPGFGSWSVKDGVVHVKPPVEILREMVTLRLHLDACDELNGALRVIPGSHLAGDLDAQRIAAVTSNMRTVTCSAARGDALLMNPLLLHCSAPAKTPLHRRVLHIEYASTELPNGLEWFDR